MYSSVEIISGDWPSYFAAIWANDQAEYVNPFFPYLGYPVGNESAMVSYKHFARFMNKDFKPIPSSIIAEGDDIWNGAGDRGDGAMIAYGASRYALTLGSKEKVDQLTETLLKDGYEVISGPRTTGDGYYESCIKAVEENLIEITI